MLTWLTETTLGKIVATFFISMAPVVELRAGLPYGIALGLDYPVALAAAVLGNLLPVPFIIVFIRRVFAWLRKISVRLDRLITRLENKAHLKGHLVQKYGPLGLCLLVAIPLPGTGAWTGSLVAAFLDLRLKRAIPSIVLGVFIAAGIMTAVTYGLIHIFQKSHPAQVQRRMVFSVIMKPGGDAGHTSYLQSRSRLPHGEHIILILLVS